MRSASVRAPNAPSAGLALLYAYRARVQTHRDAKLGYTNGSRRSSWIFSPMLALNPPFLDGR